MALVAVAKAVMSPAPVAAMSSKSQIELAPCWLLIRLNLFGVTGTATAGPRNAQKVIGFC